MSAIEQMARAEWRRWGDGYACFCACSACGEIKQCRGKKRAHMLCLECWDAGEQ